MAEKRPLCLYGGDVKEMADGDSVPGPGRQYILGDVVFSFQPIVRLYDASGTVQAAPAQANSVNTPAVGFVNGGGSAGSLVTVSFSGVCPGFSGLTPGAAYYLSRSSSGGITTTKPTTVGDIVQCVGFAISDTEIFFMPHTPEEVI